MTDRWMRSPRGKIFGVATGLAEWRDLPPESVRIIVFLIILFTGVFPGVLIYLVLALFLPYEGAGAARRKGRSFDDIRRDAEDADWQESAKTNEDLRSEYEKLKRKVEEMENEMFDKEKDWDDRFSRS